MIYSPTTKTARLIFPLELLYTKHKNTAFSSFQKNNFSFSFSSKPVNIATCPMVYFSNAFHTLLLFVVKDTDIHTDLKSHLGR